MRPWDDRVKIDRNAAQIERLLRNATSVPEELRWACDRALAWGVWEEGRQVARYCPRGEQRELFPGD